MYHLFFMVIRKNKNIKKQKAGKGKYSKNTQEKNKKEKEKQQKQMQHTGSSLLYPYPRTSRHR